MNYFVHNLYTFCVISAPKPEKSLEETKGLTDHYNGQSKCTKEGLRRDKGTRVKTCHPGQGTEVGKAGLLGRWLWAGPYRPSGCWAGKAWGGVGWKAHSGRAGRCVRCQHPCRGGRRGSTGEARDLGLDADGSKGSLSENRQGQEGARITICQDNSLDKTDSGKLEVGQTI